MASLGPGFGLPMTIKLTSEPAKLGSCAPAGSFGYSGMRTRTFIRLTAALCLGAAAAVLSVSAQDWAAPHRAALLAGVSRIPAPGLPGPVVVFETNAFPVAAAAAGRGVAPLLAAAVWGKGRVVVYGHDGFFSRESLGSMDGGRLLANAVRWSSGAKTNLRAGVWRDRGAAAFLNRGEIGAKGVSGALDQRGLAEIDVLVADTSALESAEHRQALRQFVQDGGGLVLGGLGWGWLQLNPGKTLREQHPGNLLLAGAGLAWGDGMFESKKGGFDVSPQLPSYLGAVEALAALRGHESGAARLETADLARAAATLVAAGAILPPGNLSIGPALDAFKAQGAEIVPSVRTPLDARRAVDRLKFAQAAAAEMSAPPARVRRLAAAADFPGEPPAGAPRVTRQVTVDARVPQWHSTGLHAAPGEVITVTVPEDFAKRGWKVRIGCHSDSIAGLDTWRRAPEITRVFALDKPVTQAASPFGGLIYIEVPRRGGSGEASVTIAGAVRAPYFKLGQTDPAQWRAELRSLPGPWAELEGRYMTVTVPSENIRNLDAPEEVCQFWDRVQEANARLAALPSPRQDRFVLDRQISAGYMHSGYPVMAHLDVAGVVADPAALKKGNWGFFHELGHNHQSPVWTLEGTGEVTCNLFSMHSYERVCGLPMTGHDAMSTASRTRRMKKFFAQDGGYEDWKKDPFLALILYYQLAEGFGWDAYSRVFAACRDLPDRERPKTDDAKRDLFLTQFSKATGRNLGPFFEAWHLPTSASAREALKNLPAWMPSANFPKAYQGE